MLELKIHQAQLIVRELVFSKFIAQTLSSEINQSPQALIGKVGRIYFRLNQTSIVAGNTVGEGLLLAGSSQWHPARNGQASHGAPAKPRELSFD